MEYIHDFKGKRNVANYSTYNEEFSKKPTTFYSNIHIPLKTTNKKSKVVMISEKGDSRKSISGYNVRSNIPLELIKEILITCMNGLEI